MVGEGINDNPQAAPGSVAEWSKTCQIAVEARRPSGETLLRAELTIMREIIVVLVRAPLIRRRVLRNGRVPSLRNA
jgi:hypothetical protein